MIPQPFQVKSFRNHPPSCLLLLVTNTPFPQHRLSTVNGQHRLQLKVHLTWVCVVFHLLSKEKIWQKE